VRRVYAGPSAACGAAWFVQQAGTRPICFCEGQHQKWALPRALSVSRAAPQGYDEVHVPALKPKPFGEDERLYYIGVFNMDYFLHDAISYRLQVQRAAQHLCPAPLGAAPRPAARPCEACLAVPLCARMRRGGTLTGNIPGCSPPLYWQNVRAGMPRPACNPSALGL